MREIDFDIDDLYAWIDTIPLSRPKKNISRDFADGVLLAEVIAFHLPKLVDLHNYPASHSIPQKKDNWETLNRKVFSKIGFKVSNESITSLIEAKPGVIEEILQELRTILCKHSTCRSSRSRSRPGTPVCTSTVTTPAKSTTPKQSPRDMHIEGTDEKEHSSFQEELSRQCSGTDISKESPMAPRPLEISKESALEQQRQQINNNQAPAKRSTKSKQGYVAHVTLNNQCSVGCIPSSAGIALSATDEKPPQQIIYRGHKMVPLRLLDEKEKEMKTLETTNRSLTQKIFRLETLMNIKDQRVEDLTHQIQNLRSMYERVCEASLMRVRSR